MWFTQPLTEISTRNRRIMFLESRARRVRGVDNLAAICQPIIKQYGINLSQPYRLARPVTEINFTCRIAVPWKFSLSSPRSKKKPSKKQRESCQLAKISVYIGNGTEMRDSMSVFIGSLVGQKEPPVSIGCHTTERANRRQEQDNYYL
jgi:hypothetical protein